MICLGRPWWSAHSSFLDIAFTQEDFLDLVELSKATGVVAVKYLTNAWKLDD